MTKQLMPRDSCVLWRGSLAGRKLAWTPRKQGLLVDRHGGVACCLMMHLTLAMR